VDKLKKIGYVSTFPPNVCGIGTYTEQLTTALTEEFDDVSIIVFSEQGILPRHDGPRLEVQPVYRRDSDYVEDLERAIADSGCPLVHFQHAGDLFGEDERLPRLLERLTRRGIRSVVTLHTVYGESRSAPLGRGNRHTDFYRRLAQPATCLLVHQEQGCATTLRSLRIDSAKVAVIPHGTPGIEQVEQSLARQTLDLPADAFLFTFFGFIHLQKNVHRIVEAFAKLVVEFPNARLLVSGMPWGNRWYNHLYTALIKARIDVVGLGSKILIRDRYLEPTKIPHVYAASDVILLPHNQTYGSSSGVFHGAMGAGNAVLYSASPKFSEAREALQSVPELEVPMNSTEAWLTVMRRVMVDKELLERARHAARTYAATTAWPSVAASHVKLYQTLLT
jgi:glycosyltransferase involved in cell wall biosynthesis